MLILVSALVPRKEPQLVWNYCLDLFTTVAAEGHHTTTIHSIYIRDYHPLFLLLIPTKGKDTNSHTPLLNWECTNKPYNIVVDNMAHIGKAHTMRTQREVFAYFFSAGRRRGRRFSIIGSVPRTTARPTRNASMWPTARPPKQQTSVHPNLHFKNTFVAAATNHHHTDETMWDERSKVW